MILDIVTYPRPVLRKRCQPVARISDAERGLFEDMTETMYQAHGVGLAASQVGVGRQLIVFDDGQGLVKLANPKISHRKGRATCEEGCLSIPGITVKVKRAKELTLCGLNQQGVRVTLNAQGVLARIIQHECDHLQGKLIIDYLNLPRRLLLKRRLKKAVLRQSEGLRAS